MSSAWRNRVQSSGFADVLPYLETQSAELDAGIVDETWLSTLGLAPEDLSALTAALRAPEPPVPVATPPVAAPAKAPVTPSAPVVPVGPDVAALARARVTRALAEGDANTAAAALSAIATPTDTDGRTEFAAWLSGITLARTSNDAFVTGALGVAHALQVASAQAGPVSPGLTATLQALTDHAAHLDRAAKAKEALLRKRMGMGAAAVALLAVVVGIAYMATRSSQFVVGQTGQDTSCGGMFEVCVRAKCEVTNVGNSPGTANIQMNGTIRKYDGEERSVTKNLTLPIEPGTTQVAVFNVPEVEVMETLNFECSVSG